MYFLVLDLRFDAATLFRNVPTRITAMLPIRVFTHSQRENRHLGYAGSLSQLETPAILNRIYVSVSVDSNNYWVWRAALSIPCVLCSNLKRHR